MKETLRLGFGLALWFLGSGALAVLLVLGVLGLFVALTAGIEWLL